MSIPSVSHVRTGDGIEWYCERRGTGTDLILIPSGEGDRENFAKVAALLAGSFTVTTFDMPGMSRTTAPETAMKALTASKLAAQIVGLMDKLGIAKASFWGCSSGALTALALAADSPDRVQCTVVHEAPLAPVDSVSALKSLDDATIIQVVSQLFATGFCEDDEKWQALGPAYHKRLERNYITWVRMYVLQVERDFSKDELNRRPTTWTIGALMPAGFFHQNVVDGYAAGIPVGLLPCKHFPQVTIPEILAKHIQGAVKQN